MHSFEKTGKNKRGNLSVTPKNEALTISAKRKPFQLVLVGVNHRQPLGGNNTQQQRKHDDKAEAKSMSVFLILIEQMSSTFCNFFTYKKEMSVN